MLRAGMREEEEEMYSYAIRDEAFDQMSIWCQACLGYTNSHYCFTICSVKVAYWSSGAVPKHKPLRLSWEESYEGNR